jgi:hypothetical protein
MATRTTELPEEQATPESIELEEVVETVVETVVEETAAVESCCTVVLDGEGYEAVAERMSLDVDKLYEKNMAAPIHAGMKLCIEL